MRGCLRWVGGLLVVGAIAAAAVWAWGRWGDDVRRLWQRWRGDEPVAQQVSPETAARAEAKIERVRVAGDTVALSAVELTSLVRYRLIPRLPVPLDSAEVTLRGDTVRLRARVPVVALPPSPELAVARAVLPDTAEVDVRGRVVPARANEAAFEILAARVAGVTVPGPWIPRALDRLGRPARSDLPATAYPVRLPPGVGSARSRGDSLYLYPTPGSGAR